MTHAIANIYWPRRHSLFGGRLSIHNPLVDWEERARQRLHLARLIDEAPHLLHDVGLTEQAARREIAKPFWRR